VKVKKPQKIAQSREGVDKLKDLCEQKIHTHLSYAKRARKWPRFHNVYGKRNFVYVLY